MSGYDRVQFDRYQADLKRAFRHLQNTVDLAYENGVDSDALADAFLSGAAVLKTRTRGRRAAITSLYDTLERVMAGDFGDVDRDQVTN